MKVTMRKARRTDIDGMNRIFNENMKREGGCLDIDAKDYDYRLEWFTHHDKKHPVFVGELDERMICWVALSRYNTDYPYDGVALLSMYLDSSVELPGLQDSLLRFIEAQAHELGYYKLVIMVFASNRVALHGYRTAGFRDVGIYRNHAYYKGELVDMVFMERLLPVDMEQLKDYYRKTYPFYEEYFCREEAMQELHMLRNGMVRSPEDYNKWIPAVKEGPDAISEDWGGATVRTVHNIPSLEELVEQRLAEQRSLAQAAPPEPPEPQIPRDDTAAEPEPGEGGNPDITEL
ncbi:MAG: GNAT family N-acetyltransferase [Angelakisella sp.]